MIPIPQAFEIALQHHLAGRLAEAEALYRGILAVQPNHADSMHMLGVIAHQIGRLDLAAELIRHAIVLEPNNPVAHCNLGLVCHARGSPEEAITSYHRALQLKPDHAEAHNNLGIALVEQRKLDEAVEAFRRALQLKADYPEACNNLANALRESGKLDEAIAAFNQSLQLKPDSADTHYYLGNTLFDRGKIDEAYEEFERAFQLRPGDATIISKIILTLHFRPGDFTHRMTQELQRWDRQFSEPRKRLILPHRHDRHPERHLRIGYVSPDFCDHVVGRNLLPLVRCHDRQDFEITCYSGVIKPDIVTEEFRRYAHHWRRTVGVSDEALAAMIRQDGIDVLVDLSQHTLGNRLTVFPHQPAPVQVSFAGYPESAGIEAIGYRISDRYLEAEASKIGVRSSEFGFSLPADLPSLNSDLRPATEEQVFLLDSFWCYDPCGVEVEVNGLPANGSGMVTFGSLNNFFKINEPVLRLWARVLEKVPNSRLVLLSDPDAQRQWVLRVLQGEGIEAQRVEFVKRLPRRQYFELYHRLDLVLDPFPYGGHTTSLDALWMGVPVVSLAGERAVSRAGLSQMSNLGLRELVAFSEDEYIALAAKLARDLPRLAELRRTLRARMQSSPLMDAPRFARQVEAAYRAMWRRWCTETGP